MRNNLIFRNKIHIYDQWFQNFTSNTFETAKFWYIVNLTAILGC